MRSRNAVSALVGAGICLGFGSCAIEQAGVTTMRDESALQSDPTPDVSADGESIPVGGDLSGRVEASAATSKDDGTEFTEFRFGRHAVTTPLPDGYPAPTPPGAVEIKRYPAARRAEVTRTDDPDGMVFGWIGGKNAGFWPLFRHIESRGIPMTAPVETDLEREGGRSWTMAFLYRSPSIGSTGPAARGVQVRDAPAATVLSLGVSGNSGSSSASRSVELLRTWLSSHPEWREGGPVGVRVLNYNDPFTKPQWSEVQIGIERTPPPGG